MKKNILSVFAMVILGPALSIACSLDMRSVAEKVAPNPTHIRIADTDQLDDWSKTMGTYITFESQGKFYAGYLRLDQWSCQLKFSDIRELVEVF